MKEVRDDVASRMNVSHRKAIERVIRKLCVNDPQDMDVVINEFWKGFKRWQHKSGKYGVNIGRCLIPEVVRGVSHIWHEWCSSLY